MKRITSLLAALALGFGLAGSARAYTFVTLNYPGATQTYAYGINDSGHISGFYTDGSGGHGFVYDGSTWTTLDYPGTSSTYAYDINDSGVIAGRYYDGSWHGFIYDSGTWITLDVPGATETAAWGINNSGVAVGHYAAGSGVHAFVYDSGTYTTLHVPGAASRTFATGINDSGDIVGYYLDGSNWHGFVYDGSTYTTQDYPSVNWTYATDINDSGNLVGYYDNGSGWYGFVYNGNTYTTLNIPASDYPETQARGINDAGDLVGFYYGGDGMHGFIANAEVVLISTATSAASFDSSGSSDDPVNTYTGELFKQYSPDVNLGGPMPLYFSRHYASGLLNANISGSMGDNWRHNFEWTLTDTGSAVSIVNHKGRLIQFTQNGAAWDLTGKTDIVYQLTENAGVFTLLDPRSRRMYKFNAPGQLTGIGNGKGNVHTLSYDGSGLLVQVTDGLGRTLSFSYDAGELLASVGDGVRTVTFVHTVDDLTQVTDALGNITTYAYNSGGLMTSFTLPAGNTPYSQTWNGSGQVASQTDSGGNTTTFTYTASDTTITDALADSRVHGHTATGELSGSQDRVGSSVTIGSDADGRRNLVTDRLGGVTSFAYHAASGKLASKNNADGTGSSFSYTARASGNVTQYDLTGITNADGTTESFVYDARGNLISRTDRAGNTSSATYNSNGQPLTTTNTAGGVTTYTYNADASVATRVDPAGNTTTFGHDTLRRLSQLTFADASTRLFTYDAEDRRLSSIDENANSTTFSYDANGNLATITDPLINTTTFAYEGNDRLLSATDQLGGVVNATYDALGRPETTTDENNNKTTSGYDTLGRLATVTYPNGNSNSFTYDTEGVLASAGDGLGNTTTFTTDMMGRLTQTSSPLGNISQIGYDAMGRIISTTDPLNQTTTFNRDGRGLLTGIDLPGGIISATYTRNSLGDITQITDSSGNSWQSSFNNQGLLTSRTDPLNNVQTVAYDNRNRPAIITYADGVMQTLGYDPAGNLTSRSYSGGGPVFNYSYDANNRLTSADGVALAYDANNRITGSNGITLSRVAGGRIISMTLAAGKSVTYTYDANDNLISVTDWIIAAHNITSFSYDGNDRLTSITRPAANGVDTSYTYNNDGRLVGITEGAISSISLTRDANGQVTSAIRNVPLTASVATVSSLAYSFDAASQITTIGFVYDARGRLTDDGTKTYTWDAASRLTSLTEGAATTTYTYDALGQRLSRSSGGAARSFVWNTALDLNAISIERDGDGNDLRYFIHTPAGALLYSIDAVNNARQFYHFDELGNTIAVTDDSGDVIGSYAYTPYGKLTASTGELDNPFTWQGRYGVVDEGNGLYYMRARYHDSVTGRFISRDLIESINPRSLNPYQYASGNPMKFFDPLGLDDLDNGMESLKKLALDFIIGEVVPHNDLIPDSSRGDKETALVIAKEIIGEKLPKKAGKVLKIAVLGAKIGIIISNAYQDLENDRGKNKAQSFIHERALNAKIEAKQALLRDRDVNSLSSMSPLARDVLRRMAVKPLLEIQAKLAYLRKSAEKFNDWHIVGPQIKRLEEKEWFLLNALAGELVPGEEGWEPAVEPSSTREAAKKYPGGS